MIKALVSFSGIVAFMLLVALLSWDNAGTARSNAASTALETAPAITAIVTAVSTATPQAPTPAATATEPLPPTPGPDTPTPGLPEEGGPPGAVLAGMAYIDEDGSGSLTSADKPAGGGVGIELLDPTSLRLFIASVHVDIYTGRWEIRSVPPGTYRVRWGPPLRDPANLSRTIPPATEFPNGFGTAFLPNQTVVVTDGERILNINFGMPDEGAVAGARLPDTGARATRDSSLALLLTVAGLVVAGCGACWLSLRGRAGRA